MFLLPTRFVGIVLKTRREEEHMLHVVVLEKKFNAVFKMKTGEKL